MVAMRATTRLIIGTAVRTVARKMVAARLPGRPAEDRRRFATLESLECRRLMAAPQDAPVTLSGGELVIHGEAYRSNEIKVEANRTGRSLRVLVNGHAGSWISARNVSRIVIDGGERNDAITVDGRISIPVRVDGRGGSDQIRTASGPDTIYGGEGNDTIFAGAGADHIEGGAGKDRIDGGSGDDSIFGGDGNDVIAGGAGSDFVRGGGGRDRIDGGVGDDTLIGDRNDSLAGGSGADLYRYNASRLLAADSTGAGTTVNRVTGFTLIDADTDRPVPGFLDLADGQTLDLAKLPKHPTLRVNAPDGFKGSIEIKANGKTVQTENLAPYALFGDTKGNYGTGPFPTGTVRLEAIAYAGANRTGGAGGGRAITLKVLTAAKAVPAPPKSSTTSTTSKSSTTSTKAAPASVPPVKPVAVAEPSPSGGWNVPTISATATGAAPVARIQALFDNVAVGTAVHVDGLGSTLNAGDAEDGIFAWDFGDAGSRFNETVGFNAAHLYAKPGTYTVRLSVTNAAGKMDSATARVTVAAAQRKVLYVSAAGADSNDGRSADRPLRTVKKAASLAGDDTEILFARGQTFGVEAAMKIYGKDVVIGAYGTGERPVLNWVGGLGLNEIVQVGPAADGVTVRDLTFTSKYGGTDSAGLPFALRIGGRNVTVLGNQFFNVSYAINSNGRPTGALVQDNASPSVTGVRAYFLWGEGRNLVVQGNFVANSTREHVVRLSGNGVSHVVIAHNDFTNLDRRAEGDRYDTAKGAIVAQVGEYAYIADNIVNGPLAIGPLGEENGLHSKEARFSHVVVTRNSISGAMLEVKHGSEHVTLHDNVIFQTGGTAIEVEGFNKEYGRGVVDLVIDHNTAVNPAEMGRFLQVQGSVGGIVLTDNVYLAPNLRPGAYGAAAIYVAQADLSSFVRLDHNVWPSGSKGLPLAGGGVAWVGGGTGYLTPAQWEARRRVTNSTFRDVDLDRRSYHATVNGHVSGARLVA